jgi:hypothetical protein
VVVELALLEELTNPPSLIKLGHHLMQEAHQN